MDDDEDEGDSKSRRSGYTATSPLDEDVNESAVDQLEIQESESVPFRALDLLQGSAGFKRDLPQAPSPGSAGLGEVPRTPLDLFGGAEPSLFDASEGTHDAEQCEPQESDESVEIVEPEADRVSEQSEDVQTLDAVAPQQTWNEMVASSFAQFRAVPADLQFPWETGPMAAVFNFDDDPLPRCPGLAEMPVADETQPADSLQHRLSRFLMPEDAKYMHAVKSIQDMSYFEGKAQQLDLACGQWLRILSVSWSSSGVGPQLATALQKDNTGVEACVILKACFGVKSPSTLLKRAGAFKKFFAWYDKSMVCREINSFPLPLDESVVWEYFLHLKRQRESDARGYTVPSAFLEAVRPLSTAEAATWLRTLLQGTTSSDSFRSHSLKASLLIWCARAGLAIEDEAMRGYGLVSTPAPFTPAMAARTPVGPVAEPETAPVVQKIEERGKEVVDSAVAAAADVEDLQSVKEEEWNAKTLEDAAAELTLYPVELVSAGVVEIESSSGSDSESTSSDSDSSTSSTVQQAQGPHMVEHVPEGLEFYRHVKSGLVHSCKEGQEISTCKIQIGVNFKKLARKIFVVHPKCIRCFPKNHNRIRSCEQMSQNIDAFLKKAKASDSKES
eukprot:s3870_g4.t1